MESNNRFNKILEKIGKNKKICLFGTGDISRELYDAINNSSNNNDVVFFADTYKEGKCRGVEIIKPFDLKSKKNDIDVAIVTSFANGGVMRFMLELAGIKNVISLDRNIYRAEYISKSEEAEKVFDSESDKRLYRLITDTRISENTDDLRIYVRDLFHEKISYYSPLHYFEHINPNVITTVIDAGAKDALHSLLFEKTFKNVQNIYTFEPMYEKFKDQGLDPFIQESSVIEIVPMGLWDEKAQLYFREDTIVIGSSNFSQIPPQENESSVLHENMPVTTIDDFVEENNISKIDFIKMDVENAEMKVLLGARKTIEKSRPQMAISIYHSDEQFYSIPVYLKNTLKDYVFRIGHYSKNLSETVLYAIPKELI